MDKNYIKLLKEYVLMNDREVQDYADNRCFYCKLYMNRGEGQEPCKFQNICEKDQSDLRKELSEIIDELIK
jgi:hypothetical protein